jgi:hypothetical protein
MGTIVSLIAGGLFCTFSFKDAIPFIFRYGWSFFFYLLGKSILLEYISIHRIL